MATKKPISIADLTNGSVSPMPHDDDVLVMFTEPGGRPRNVTVADVPALRAKYQKLDDERATVVAKRDAARQAADDVHAEAMKDIEKRTTAVNAEAFALARKQLTKVEKGAARAAAAAATEENDA